MVDEITRMLGEFGDPDQRLFSNPALALSVTVVKFFLRARATIVPAHRAKTSLRAAEAIP